MNPPWLVLISGLPSSGKSTVAQHLMENYRFTRLSSDMLREAVYGMDYPSLQKKPQGQLRETALFEVISASKNFWLNYGLSVVVDCVAPTQQMRQGLLDTTVGKNIIPARKLLIVLRANEAIVNEREVGRQRNYDLSVWTEYWQPPVKLPDYKLLLFENNTVQDREHIFQSIDQVLNER